MDALKLATTLIAVGMAVLSLMFCTIALFMAFDVPKDIGDKVSYVELVIGIVTIMAGVIASYFRD